MQFKTPEFFALILFLLLISFWLFYSASKKHKSAMKYSSIKNLKKANKGFRSLLKDFPLVLKLFALILVIVALARPQRADTLTKKNVEGVDIVIALDISDSMLIEDMKPNNRLEAAKGIISDFIEKRVSDRISIVVFAGESFTLVPLTLDYDVIRSRVAEITTARRARIKDGTAIGVALANAASRLRESSAKNRVIIFLTDGENNSGTIDPATALDIAKGYNLKIYSIGLGKDGPTRIPVMGTDVFGNPVKTYQPFESFVNDELLNKMAAETNGKYYRATDEKGLVNVFADIDRLEKTKIEVNKYTKYTELFPSYLGAAIFFLMVSFVLSSTLLRRAP